MFQKYFSNLCAQCVFSWHKKQFQSCMSTWTSSWIITKMCWIKRYLYRVKISIIFIYNSPMPILFIILLKSKKEKYRKIIRISKIVTKALSNTFQSHLDDPMKMNSTDDEMSVPKESLVSKKDRYDAFVHFQVTWFPTIFLYHPLYIYLCTGQRLFQ